MLIAIAPSKPVKTAVTAVAVTLQLAARATVLVCDSINFSQIILLSMGKLVIIVAYYDRIKSISTFVISFLLRIECIVVLLV